MQRIVSLVVLALSLSVGCRAKGMRGPNGPSLDPEASTAHAQKLEAPLAFQTACKEGSVSNNGVCVSAPSKCQKEEVYLAHEDKCVPNTAENACFSRGQVLVDGGCANQSYYAACIVKTGLTSAQEALLARLKALAGDQTCEGSYAQINKLEALDLSGFRQNLDLRLLQDFRNLEELNVEKNQITSTAGLQTLKSLQKLNLGENKIANIDALAELADLEELNLEDNKIRNITPLATLLRLRELGLSGNEVMSLTALANMTNLKTLDLHENKALKDLRPVRTLQELESLNIEGTDVTDLSPLKDHFLLELKIEGSTIARFTSDKVSEANCPVEQATSAVLFDTCSALRGL